MEDVFFPCLSVSVLCLSNKMKSDNWFKALDVCTKSLHLCYIPLTTSRSDTAQREEMACMMHSWMWESMGLTPDLSVALDKGFSNIHTNHLRSWLSAESQSVSLERGLGISHVNSLLGMLMVWAGLGTSSPGN